MHFFPYHEVWANLVDSCGQIGLQHHLSVNRIVEMPIGDTKVLPNRCRKCQVFTRKFLQLCLDFGKTVPSEAPFTLNAQLSTSSTVSSEIYGMSGAVSSWVTHVNGLSKADIDACSVDADFISVQTLVEEANVEYTMLLVSG